MISYVNAAVETTRLLLDAREGSREAFAELVRLNQELVRTYLGRYLGRADAADDLAQEVFLVAFRRLGEFRGEAEFSHWLLGIARNLAMDHLRRESRRRQRDAAAAIARWQAERLEEAGGTAAEHQRTLSALRHCVEALTPTARQVVDRFYFEQEPAESIARQINKKPGAVRMMLVRIRRALGECVAGRMQRSEGES